jgi:hypothetical protein
MNRRSLLSDNVLIKRGLSLNLCLWIESMDEDLDHPVLSVRVATAGPPLLAIDQHFRRNLANIPPCQLTPRLVDGDMQ